jgi:hypothetical protein
MINQSLRCPSCGQFGYLVATEAADLEKFVATICHYCGHVLDRGGLAECLGRGDAAGDTLGSAKIYRTPRRRPGRK